MVQLEGRCGLAPDQKVVPSSITVEGPTVWPIGEALRTKKLVRISLSGLPVAFPKGARGLASTEAAVLPLADLNGVGNFGAFLVGLNPLRQLDDGYRKFLELVAGQISAAIANGYAFAQKSDPTVKNPFNSRDGKLLGSFASHSGEVNKLRLLAILAREAAQREESLQQAKEAAEKENLAKDRFLALFSHELRTPLAAILGCAQLLRRGTLSEQQVAFGLRAIEENAAVQKQLIDDLLDVSKVIMGKLPIERKVVDLSSVVSSALESARGEAEKKRIRLELISEAPSVRVDVDPTRLHQVLWNLLSNSIKFTPSGGKISLKTESLPNQEVQITVADTGKGIPPDFLPRIFDRFTQLEPTSTRSYGGLGLGLALVHSLLALMGGKIRAESLGENRGSTFIITLPVAAPLAESKQNATGKPAAAFGEGNQSLEGVKILVVEDDEPNRILIKTVLAKQGAVVETARSAPDALFKFSSFGPQIVISDIAMPGEDGYSLIKKIRQLEAREQLAPIPAIALTAFADSETRKLILDSGFQVHLAKPVELSLLENAVRRLLPASLAREVS